jgi:iron complex transport system substrate-binding protein
MLHRAGLRNIGSLAADATGGRLSLEAIVRLHPDRLLLTDDSAHAEDQGAAFLRHPALAGLMPADKRLVIPENMTVCGGPMLADAFDRLAREMERTGVTR